MDWIGMIEKSGGRVRGVIHVGANDGDEFDEYERHGVLSQVWIEPQKDPYERLLARLPKRQSVLALQAACGSERKTMTMHLLNGNKGMSNSLLKPKLHLVYHPTLPEIGEIEVPVVPLDELLDENGVDLKKFNLLVMDVQGFEMEVLKGGVRALPSFDFVLSEVNAEELYEGCVLVGEMDSWLSDRGFHRAETDWCGVARSWGDALYKRS